VKTVSPGEPGGRVQQQASETFWARQVGPTPVAMWTLVVSAPNADDAETAALRAIGSCAEELSAELPHGLAFRVRAVT
jgi:hypothetical protein